MPLCNPVAFGDNPTTAISGRHFGLRCALNLGCEGPLLVRECRQKAFSAGPFGPEVRHASIQTSAHQPTIRQVRATSRRRRGPPTESSSKNLQGAGRHSGTQESLEAFPRLGSIDPPAGAVLQLQSARTVWSDQVEDRRGMPSPPEIPRRCPQPHGAKEDPRQAHRGRKLRIVGAQLNQGTHSAIQT